MGGLAASVGFPLKSREFVPLPIPSDEYLDWSKAVIMKIEGGPSAKSVEKPAINETAQARAGTPREAAVAAAPAADGLKLTGEALGLKTVARELSTPAKLDMAKIKEIRESIDSGGYQIHPQEIADRLLALEREILN